MRLKSHVYVPRHNGRPRTGLRSQSEQPAPKFKKDDWVIVKDPDLQHHAYRVQDDTGSYRSDGQLTYWLDGVTRPWAENELELVADPPFRKGAWVWGHNSKLYQIQTEGYSVEHKIWVYKMTGSSHVTWRADELNEAHAPKAKYKRDQWVYHTSGNTPVVILRDAEWSHHHCDFVYDVTGYYGRIVQDDIKEIAQPKFLPSNWVTAGISGEPLQIKTRLYDTTRGWIYLMIGERVYWPEDRLTISEKPKKFKKGDLVIVVDRFSFRYGTAHAGQIGRVIEYARPLSCYTSPMVQIGLMRLRSDAADFTAVKTDFAEERLARIDMTDAELLSIATEMKRL